jgi:hypothetical protein
MTPLKALMLKILKTDGPLSDLGIWTKLRDLETGGLSATVVICCIELQRDGYIEPPSHDPHSWQLSVKGMDYVASLPKIRKQEVCLGS